jgi:hypothetical protein
VISRNDAFQRRADDLHRARGNHVEVKMKSLDLFGEETVERGDIRLQSHLFAGFVELFTADFAEFRIVQQQVRQFAALLHQVQLRHAVDLAFEFAGRNAKQLTKH